MPLAEAVIVADVEFETFFVLTAKVLLVAPAGTVTLEETVAFVLLLASAIILPPVGAAAVNVTVPVDD